MALCTTCRGKKKCPECGGNGQASAGIAGFGTITCKACSGTGNCKNCAGKGHT